MGSRLIHFASKHGASSLTSKYANERGQSKSTHQCPRKYGKRDEDRVLVFSYHIASVEEVAEQCHREQKKGPRAIGSSNALSKHWAL